MPQPVKFGRKTRMSFSKINEVAAMPNLIRADVMVMPNVLLPILMAVLAVLANIARKKPGEKPAGVRLDVRK